jgi:hypothetical protein
VTVANFTSFKEAKEKKRKEEERNWKRRRYRYLGGRVHVAHWDYGCDHCIFSIRPGEQYRRDTYVNAFHFRIERTHWPQCYGPTEEEDREIREQIEREREAEREAERNAA